MRLAILSGAIAVTLLTWLAVASAQAQVFSPVTGVQINAAAISDIKQQLTELRRQLRDVEAAQAQLAVLQSLVNANEAANIRRDTAVGDLAAKFDKGMWGLIAMLIGLVMNLVFTYRGRRT